MTESLLSRLIDPKPLGPVEARATLDALVSPDSGDPERAALLVGLAVRKVSIDELALFAREIGRRAVRFPYPRSHGPVDLCGSGGARTPSYNVSTVSAFVVAAAGAPVIKHGNRSARGPCGSSDLLEALGLPVTTSLPFARATYRAVHLAFLHAPLYHPATRSVAAARKAVRIPTIFNQLGPLSNPANVPFQVVGVPDVRAAERSARVLGLLGRRRAMAVSSAEGCDEFSPAGTTLGLLSSGGRIYERTFEARAFLPREDRLGEWGPLPPSEAAEEALRVLAGGGGARRGSVLLTAGAALWVAGRVRTVSDGVEAARRALDSGRAEATLDRLREIAAHFAPPSGG
jgi:anthranilate phosphoribosyltransferase